MENYDIIIVGGGLAGLTAAIHLSKEKHSVLVLEKKDYPHHKVCGEYVSKEIVPYLKGLGVDLNASNAISINLLKLSTTSGKSTQAKLPLGGMGISRYTFDNMLYEKALANGVKFIFKAVTTIDFQVSHFEVHAEDQEMYTARIVIGAYGKRSSLDKNLNRAFIKKNSGWLAVKAHYEFNEFPENEVALHNFIGGYGGLSKTETGAVNFCYLASYKSFQKERDVRNFNKNIIAKNPFLNDFLGRAKPLFDEPLTIAQISFERKQSVEGHILMCGDTAGLIHPLCGNGMAMAIHSAKIAAEGIHRYFEEDSYTRAHMEKDYEHKWNKTFKQRLWMGRRLQALLLNEDMSNLVLKAVTTSPALLRKLIKMTHGKPIAC